MYKKLFPVFFYLLPIFILSSCGRNNSSFAKNNNRMYEQETTIQNTDNLNTASSEPTPPSSVFETSTYKPKEKVTQIVSSFTTNFDASKTNRVYNIKKASKIISGTIVEEGETFSFNDVVGATGEEQGYKKAITYVNGEEKENFGGGICQISSTILNALYPLKIDILEQHHHSLPVPYVEAGKDASVSYGSLDFKFINNNPYPIQINVTVNTGKITVDIFKVEYK